MSNNPPQHGSNAAYDPEVGKPASTDDSYASRPSQKGKPIPVVPDDAPLKDPSDTVKTDSAEALEQDDTGGVDRDNILRYNLRGAAPTGSYRPTK